MQQRKDLLDCRLARTVAALGPVPGLTESESTIRQDFRHRDTSSRLDGPGRRYLLVPHVEPAVREHDCRQRTESDASTLIGRPDDISRLSVVEQRIRIDVTG